MKLTRIHHVAVICSDYPRSLEFYTKTLGLRMIAENYRADRKSYKADLAIGDDYVVELFSFPSPTSRVTNPEAAGLRHLAFAQAVGVVAPFYLAKLFKDSVAIVSCNDGLRPVIMKLETTDEGSKIDYEPVER